MNYTPTWNPPDPPQEAETKQCPHCQGHDTHFERFADEARNTEVYYCWDCKVYFEVYFEVEIDIPF